MADLGQQSGLRCNPIEETRADVPGRHIEGLGDVAIVLVSLVGSARVEFQPPLRRSCAIPEGRKRARAVPAVRCSGERPVDRTARILLDEVKRRRRQIGACGELVARRSDDFVLVEVVGRTAEIVPIAPVVSESVYDWTRS